MSTPAPDIWEIEAALLARIQQAAPAGVTLKTTTESIDWTADDSPCVGGHLVFTSPAAAGQAGNTGMLSLGWAFHVFLDLARAAATDQTTAQALYTAALRALVGWDYRPGKPVTLTGGMQTGRDPEGGLLRLSITFNTPAPVAGL